MGTCRKISSCPPPPLPRYRVPAPLAEILCTPVLLSYSNASNENININYKLIYRVATLCMQHIVDLPVGVNVHGRVGHQLHHASVDSFTSPLPADIYGRYIQCLQAICFSAFASLTRFNEFHFCI